VPPALVTALPRRLFVIQPVSRRSRPIRCDGVRFAFTARQDHLAFVSGTPSAGFVSVDGVKVYPRRGSTFVASDPAWSRDGMAVAFVETPTAARPRLVLLAEYDNPTGDTAWDLPASSPLDGVRVFWSGTSRLVVGKTALHPLFAASFTKQRPDGDAQGRFRTAGP
jgi:hypothetical protein